MSDKPILTDEFRVNHVLAMHERGELYHGIGPKRPVSLLCEEVIRLRQTITEQHKKLLVGEIQAARWRWLREQCGYHQDGSQTTVTLHQDDATRSAFIGVGGITYGTDGSTFEGIIDQEVARDKEFDNPHHGHP